MKSIKFVFNLILQTFVGIFMVNLFFLIATIMGAINHYPNRAIVNVRIDNGD